MQCWTKLHFVDISLFIVPFNLWTYLELQILWTGNDFEAILYFAKQGFYLVCKKDFNIFMRYSFLKLFLVLYTFLIKKKKKYCISFLGHLVKMENLIFTLISKLVFYEVFADISQNQSMLMREIFFLVT